MNESVLKQLLGELLEKEFSEYDDPPEWNFSLKHCLAMKRIFAGFERNSEKIRKKEAVEDRSTGKNSRHLGLKQRLIIAAVLIFLTTLLVGWVIIFVSGNFSGTVYPDNTHLTIANIEGSPQTIEYKYALVSVPEGFELIEADSSLTNSYLLYMNTTTKQTIALSQWVKSHYAPHFNTERRTLEEINVNGKKGLYVDVGSESEVKTLLTWDNDDYIIEILADIDKKEALDLSVSTNYNFSQ